MLNENINQFSRSVLFNSLQPHGLQHTRLPCPSSKHLYFNRILKFFKNNFIIYFIFVCVRPSLMHEGFVYLQQEWGYHSLWYQASHCGGFSCRSQALRSTHFSSWCTWTQELQLPGLQSAGSVMMCMWNLPWPGIEPVSPALAAGFLSTVPPGKSGINIFMAISHLFYNAQ